MDSRDQARTLDAKNEDANDAVQGEIVDRINMMASDESDASPK